MAKNIIGSELTVEIPNNLFSQFDKLQQALDATAEAAGKTGEKFVDMFKQINTQGIDAYLQKLYDTKVALETITSQNPRNDSALKQLKTDAAESLDLINKMIDTLSKAYGVKAPTTTTADTKQEIADLQRINELHHERMDAMRQMYRFGQAEASKTTLTEGETAQMSNIKARYEAAQSELNLMRERGDLSTKVMDQMTKNETQFVFAEADLERRRQQTFKDTADKEIKEAERVAKEQEELRRKSYTGAVDFSNNAKTYKDEEQAIRYLKEARANLLQTDADYATKLNTLNEAIERHTKNMKDATLTDEQRAEIEKTNIENQIAEYDRLLAKIQEFEAQKELAQGILDNEEAPAGTKADAQESSDFAIAQLDDLNKKKEDIEVKLGDKIDGIRQKYRNKDLQSEQKALNEKKKIRDKAEYQDADKALADSRDKTKTKSINDQIKAIQRLKVARDNLDKSSMSKNEYKKKIQEINKEIQRQQQEIDRLQNKSRGAFSAMGNAMNGLKGKLAAVFSVQALTGFVNKLLRIRGEMEMQQRSLQVLLQSKEEANKLWDKTVALAIKSPFTVKELTTYTKQLAAYRIESDKLYETNKRLADISAGLGVDMNRLILAYGQVKAASFLRATELRQFTEAGIPMLEELAEYFSNLEGRMISVGDVMERISKRGVMFKDVEAVIKGITDEGGTFYQMQEKQAETTQGIMRNIADKIELMFNDIGQSHDGIIKSSLLFVMKLIDAWRSLVPVVSTLVGMFAGMLVAKGVVAFVRVLNTAKQAIVGMTAAQNAFNLSAMKNPYIALASVIAGAIGLVIGLRQETDKLKAQMLQIERETIDELESQQEAYKNLVERANDVTASYDERKQALTQLQTVFSKILPDYMTEEKYVENLAGNYDEANAAMVTYYNNLAMERKKSAVEEKYDEDLDDIQLRLANNIKEYLTTLHDDGRITWKQYKEALRQIAPAVRQTVKEIQDGTLKLDESYLKLSDKTTKLMYSYTENIFKEMQLRMGETGRFFADAGYVIQDTWNFDDINDNVLELSNKLKDLNHELALLAGVGISVGGAEDVVKAEQYQKLKSKYDSFVELMKKWQTAYNEYLQGNMSKDDLNKKWDKITGEMVALTGEDSPMYKHFIDNFRQLGEVSVFEFGRIWGTKFVAWAKHWDFSEAGNELVKNLNENIDKSVQQEFMETETTKIINDAMTKYANQFGVDLDKLTNYKANNKQSFSDWQTMAEAQRDHYQEILKIYEEGTETEIKAQTVSKETAQIMLAFWEALIGKGKTTGAGNANKIWQDRIKLIRDMAKAYEDLNKTFADTDAESRVRESYEDYFNELFGKYKGLGFTIDRVDFTDPEGTKAALERLLDISGLEKTSQAYKDLKKAIAEVSLELERASKVAKDETLKNSIEDLFQDYEISVDLKKMGITKKEANELWGIDMISIDDLRKQLISKREEFVGKDMEKEYEEFLEKLNDMEIKAQHERLKKYTELIKGSYSELGQILIDQQKAFDEIDETFVITADVAVNKFNVPQDKIDALEQPIDELFKTISNNNLAELLGVGENVIESIREYNKYLEAQNRLAKEGVILQTQKKREELDFNLFKDSSTYQMMFSDIEHMSDVVLDMIEQKVEDVRKALGDLDATEFKEYQRILKQISDIKIERNPFKAFTESLNEVRKLQEQGLTFDVLQQQVIDLDEEIKNLTNGIAVMEKQQSKATGVMSVVYEITLQAMKARKTQAEGEQQAAENSLQSYYEAIKAEEAAIAKAKEYGQLMMDMYHSMADMFDAMGIGLDDTTNVLDAVANGILNVGMQFLQMAVQAEIAGKSIQSAMGPAGWAMMAVTALSGVLTAVFQAKDNGLQKDIERIEKEVEDLEHAFEKLEKQIEKTFNAQSLKTYSDSALRNIEDRYKKTQDMIALEEDKKKTDENAIRDMEQELEELAQQRQELVEGIVENLGGTYDVRGFAREWVDAWVDAFKETGDGLNGLKDNFHEFMQNIILEQAVMQGVGNIIKPLTDTITASLEDDYMISDAEWNKIWSQADSSMNLANQYITEFFERYPDMLKEASSSELEGLQAGIKGITEDTAQALESLLNSIRFYVAQQHENIADLAKRVFSNDDFDNPMLAQLRIIANQTSAINSLLTSVSTGGHSMGGKGLKVFIS